jgi:hypothetical protein
MLFTIASDAEFELLTQILQTRSLHEVLHDKAADTKKKMWALASYLNSTFPEEQKVAQPLFQEEFDALFKQKHLDSSS